MATSPKTRRKTPLQPDTAAPAPATITPQQSTPPAAKTRSRSKPAPAATVAPVAAPAPAPAPAKRPRKAPTTAKPTEVAVAAPAPAPAPVTPEAPAPRPARKAAPAKKAEAPATPPAAAAPSAKPSRRARPARKTMDEVPVPVPAPAAAPVKAPAPMAEVPAPAPEPASPPEAPQAPVEPEQADRPGRRARGKAPAPVPAPASAKSSRQQRQQAPRPDRSARRAKRTGADARSAPADDTVQAVLAVLAAPAAVAATPVAAVLPEPVAAPPTGPAHSAIVLVDADQRQLAWLPGHACPAELRQAGQRRIDAAGHLSPEDDAALPLLLRLASEAGHPLQVDEAVWAHLAAHRDARHRLGALEAAYPEGPASATLQQLLRAPLPLFQVEGALFAVVAGRALIADERGLGKGVMAIAAAQLWRRHFGVQRVLVLCAPSQRSAWQRAWQRFAGPADRSAPDAAQVIDGGLHQRQAMWSTTAGVRILSPEALDSDAAHLAHWAPDLIIVDEPQQLALRDEAWAQLTSPHALVLCGAPLAEQPELMDTLVSWLDVQRLGPLAALRELYDASQSGRALDEADIERLTAGLSRVMLQRLRTDLAEQLPPLVHTERLVPLAPGQREQHDAHAAKARRLLAGWQVSGYCSDTDHWRLAVALRAMQQACHRAEPSNPDSALAEATVQVLAAQLEEWATTGAPRVAVLCASEADRAQLAQRLADWLAPAGQADSDGDGAGEGGPQVTLVGPDDALPPGLDAVLQVGVPWRPRRHPAGPRGDAAPGQQWVYLVAQDSIECGLFDTLAQRSDVPRGLADSGARDYLQGERLNAWLTALQAALDGTGT